MVLSQGEINVNVKNKLFATIKEIKVKKKIRDLGCMLMSLEI